jgi:adenine-specific DNA methylase
VHVKGRTVLTSRPTEKRARKGLGAYYSPKDIVEPMVSWAIRSKSDAVLDPSCGDGVFLESAARHFLSLGNSARETSKRLHGIDLNLAAISHTSQALEKLLATEQIDLRALSFFATEPGAFSKTGMEAMTAVIGNPPYIRYQTFNGNHRSQALLQARRAGIDFSRLASSWAPFVAHAVSFLKSGGRLAFILPAELIHSAYALPLRKFLRKQFGYVAVISFRKAVFPEVQAEVVVLLADNKGDEGNGRLLLAEAEDARDLSSIEAILVRAKAFSPELEPSKWSPGFSENRATTCLSDLEKNQLFQPLSLIGKANIGFVSGANEFFVLRQSEAEAWSLPKHSLRACLIKARQMPGALVTLSQAKRLVSSDERCLLWSPKERLTPTESRYTRHGEGLGLHKRFKCRVRSPWYSVPGVIVPEAFLTYMSDSIPRLCLNESRIVAANTLLTVRLPAVPNKLLRAFTVAFYNSASLYSCERVGRTYGGGVLKLEPSEADRISLPALGIVEKHSESLEALAGQVDEALRIARHDLLAELVTRIDGIILAQGCGLRTVDIAELMKERGQMVERRRGRSKRRAGSEAEIQLKLLQRPARYSAHVRRPPSLPRLRKPTRTINP